MANRQPEKENPLVLPTGIKASDCKPPSWKDKDKWVTQFQLWYATGIGWVIPTLLIRNAPRRSNAGSARTYATTLDGKPCRVGMGPHVKQQLTVYVRQSRQQALQPFLDLQAQGAETSNMIRDRISTRRAQTEARRRLLGY